MKNLIKTIAAPLLILASSNAMGGLVSFTNSTGGVVDNSSTTQSIDITSTDILGYSDSILGINLTVDFSKCGSNYNQNGCTRVNGATYNREIVFDLFHGLNVDIVNQDVFSGQNRAARVTQTYDESAANQVGGSTLSDGTFDPVGNLDAFIGSSVLGSWDFTFADTAGSDPLIVHSWILDIELAEVTSQDAEVPAPASILLLALGLAGISFSRRKKLV